MKGAPVTVLHAAFTDYRIPTKHDSTHPIATRSQLIRQEAQVSEVAVHLALMLLLSLEHLFLMLQTQLLLLLCFSLLLCECSE